MKKRFIFLNVFIVISLVSPKWALAQDPISMIIKEGITKVIVAVDLKIQRLQTKTIWLQNAQRVVENTMSKLKLAEITDWAQKQKQLYQGYYDELRQVKAVLAYYHRIRVLTGQQLALVKQYKKAWHEIRQDKHFTPSELAYIGRVYSGILKESIRNLDQLALVVQSFTMQINDAQRLVLIDQVAEGMQQNYNDLTAFTTQNIQLSQARSRAEQHIQFLKGIHRIH